MASRATLTVRVSSARGSSRINYTSKGRYISLPVNGYLRQLLSQPVQSTASEAAFWLGVMALVQADITANP